MINPMQALATHERASLDELQQQHQQVVQDLDLAVRRSAAPTLELKQSWIEKENEKENTLE